MKKSEIFTHIHGAVTGFFNRPVLVNMTGGSPFRLLGGFALPVMVGNLFQLLYTVADSAVVGRLIGVTAFAAVGAAGFFSWLLLSMILGMTQGFGTVFAKRFGAGDSPGLQRAFRTGLGLSAAMGLALSLAGALLCKGVLLLMRTPAELTADAALYLQILLSCMWATFFYNYLASGLRALGNSRTPMFAVIASSTVNVILDYSLVKFFGMGVAGVALATVAAQLMSCLICLNKLLRVEEFRNAWGRHAWGRRAWGRRAEGAGAAPAASIRVRGTGTVQWSTPCAGDTGLTPDAPVCAGAAPGVSNRPYGAAKPALYEMLRMGGPMSLRHGLISAGGALTQYVINGYGAAFIAGIAGAWKIYGLLEIVAAGYEGAVATFVAQNYGAGRIDRMEAGVKTARRTMLAASCAIGFIVLLFGRQLLGLLVSGQGVGQVLDVGQAKLNYLAVTLPALYMLLLYRAGLQGMGNAVLPMLSGFVELAARLACVVAAPALLGVMGVYMAESAGWFAAALLVIFGYLAEWRKMRRA